MNMPTASYTKVFYDLRPAKQIERRMLIDALQHLQTAGFPIREYQYTGFGSTYFVDFILFHRFLGIKDLLSVEHDTSIEKRVLFNKPFGLVKVAMEPIGDVIPRLDRDRQHLLWLDYDARLNAEMTADMGLAASILSPGSLLLVTVDAKRPAEGESPVEWCEYYRERVGSYFDHQWSAEEFSPSHLSSTLARLIYRVIDAAVASRRSVEFSPLFNFEYADGHPMITVGGMITTTADRSKIQAASLKELSFVRDSRTETPFRISVPRLTRKERLYLDHHMPCSDGWKPDDFELSEGDVSSYTQIYRYYPSYAELML